jgi:hypothetical protein
MSKTTVGGKAIGGTLVYGGTWAVRKSFGGGRLLAWLAIICAVSVSLPAQSASAPATSISSVVPILLDRHGCSPEVSTARAGHIAISLLNQTGLNTLRIQVLGGGKTSGPTTALADATTKKNAFKLRETVSLAPGDYRIIIYGHERWTCSLVVK